MNSYTYPAVIALLVLIGYISGIEVFLVSLIVCVTAFGVLISDDLRPLVPPLLIVPFSFNLEHSPGVPNYSEYYLQTWVFVLGAILCVILAVGFVGHYLLWGGARRTFLAPSRLTPPHLLLIVGLLLNGVTTVDYTVSDFTTGLMLVFVWIVLYMVFLGGLKKGRDTMEHFCVTCQWMAILLIAELLYICITREVIQDGLIYKNNILFGWGINNNFGGILAWLLPPVFYLAAMRNRTGWLQLLLSVIMMAAIVFSMSRSALVVGGLIYVVCLVLVCLVGHNKGQFRFFAGMAVLMVMVMLIFYSDQLIHMLNYYAERGFSDSGRFDLWRDCIKNFKRHPFLGAGFHSTPFEPWSGRTFGYAHNTVVQLISAGGLVATTGYLLMRGKTIWMVLYKWNTERIFMGLGLAAILGVSLLDNHMFNIYPAFFYSITIAMIENDYNTVAGPLHAPLLRFAEKYVRRTGTQEDEAGDVSDET